MLNSFKLIFLCFYLFLEAQAKICKKIRWFFGVLEGEKNSQSNDMCTLFVIMNRARLTAMKKKSFTDTADELH